ncbi:hypothetical protein [Rugosimonospora africana]|uniref:Uncharacterized protein n=1 Tax=Rugosimonospora africana TaxID=556532 RepID=A0A8J3VUI8_9ACTN|nr:hypothetical protein [Rugosimonospora africana]GIH19602.1 hypothetical protein Raf01_77740 [Rugosimonospora africana]
MQRQRFTVALILALLWGVVFTVGYHLIEGGSWRVFLVWIPIGLIFMTPAYYLGHADRRARKCLAWAFRTLHR